MAIAPVHLVEQDHSLDFVGAVLWNAGVVGGSTRLAASVPAVLRPQTEGVGDVAIGLAVGAGAPIAGLIVALVDIRTLTLAAAVGGASC